MKKLVALLMAAIMCLGLVACGKNAQQEEELDPATQTVDGSYVLAAVILDGKEMSMEEYKSLRGYEIFGSMEVLREGQFKVAYGAEGVIIFEGNGTWTETEDENVYALDIDGGVEYFEYDNGRLISKDEFFIKSDNAGYLVFQE